MRTGQVDIDSEYLEYVRHCTQHSSDSQVECEAMKEELERFSLDDDVDSGDME